MTRAGRLAEAVERARIEAPFLALLLDRSPGMVARLERDGFGVFADAFTGDVPVAKQLRVQRRELALAVALGDLAGLLDLTAVTRRLSDFADRALDVAIQQAIRERTPNSEPRGFVAIALGKQGSRELNYSSDIDPILLFDPGTLPRRPREEPVEAAVKIGRRVIDLLQTRDGDGYVLRVDLRLRPSPELTPIALPVDAAIGYYESQALPWERAAFIRARAASGDLALGQRFLEAVRPFVWRRAIDYGTVQEVRGLTARIRDHHAAGQRFGAGYDLKRGRGGIREIEFFTQIHQLIHGGRDTALRAPATRDALAALAAAGHIGADEACTLTKAYTLLRTIEHRVQMIDDRQTHALPHGDALDRVARLHGLCDGDALLDLLRPHVSAASRLYDALDGEPRTALPHGEAALDAVLRDAGFGDPASARARVVQWRGGTYPALRSAAANAALEAVLPTLVRALGAAPDPMAALHRLDSLIERLPSAINIFRLLEARPALAAHLVAILAHAEPLAEGLARRPSLLDGLIDASAFDDVAEVPALAARMRLADCGDYGAKLDQVRRAVGEARFALGVQIVTAASDPLRVAAGYARVAEAAIKVLAEATVAEFAQAHGHLPDGEFVILALGRMGGGAMTHASDLDLVYLFTGDFASESVGPKPLGATLYYNRLAQRVTAALSVATAAGSLYAVDTRLRPSGAKGPLVVSLESFARYQREEAWTWEHMALARARVVFGSPAAQAAVEGVVAAVLRGNRPVRDVAAEAATMRREMAAHKPAQGPLDVKLGHGGLVDLEFAVHVAQLTSRSGFSPDLAVAIDKLAAGGRLPNTLQSAYALLTRTLVSVRLLAPGTALPDPATLALLATTLGFDDWPSAATAIDAARATVSAAWNEVGDG